MTAQQKKEVKEIQDQLFALDGRLNTLIDQGVESSNEDCCAEDCLNEAQDFVQGANDSITELLNAEAE